MIRMLLGLLIAFFCGTASAAAPQNTGDELVVLNTNKASKPTLIQLGKRFYLVSKDDVSSIPYNYVELVSVIKSPTDRTLVRLKKEYPQYLKNVDGFIQFTMKDDSKIPAKFLKAKPVKKK